MIDRDAVASKRALIDPAEAAFTAALNTPVPTQAQINSLLSAFTTAERTYKDKVAANAPATEIAAAKGDMDAKASAYMDGVDLAKGSTVAQAQADFITAVSVYVNTLSAYGS